jgi:voltage-gated potassium channel
MSSTRLPLRGDAEGRERAAERIAEHLDGPMTVLGVVFLLLVLAETISAPQGAVGTAFTVAGWVLWVAFVAEFLVRMVVAPSTTGFLRRSWWQLVFLAVPFLRFLRAVPALRAVRTARVGRVLSAAVRSGRSAGRTLSSRIAVLAAVTLVVVLAASQLLYELGSFERYSDALHAAALATIAGEPVPDAEGALRLLEVALVAYSVVVFATLAGSVGAYLLERGRRGAEEVAAASAAGLAGVAPGSRTTPPADAG